MDDIAPKLIENVNKDFEKNLSEDKAAAALNEKLAAGQARYVDAYNYAESVGNARAKAFESQISSDVLPEGKMHYNIASRLMNDSLTTDHEMIADYAAGVQKAYNKEAGINLKALKADVNDDRIDGFVERLSSEPVYDDISWLLREPVVTHARSVVDDTIKKNAEFQGKAGIQAKVTRNAVSDCCSWCLDIAGDYIYPAVPREVFQRHDNCRCMVDYNGRKLTAYNSGNAAQTFRDQGEQDKIEKRKSISERINDISYAKERRKIIAEKTQQAYTDIKSMFSSMQEGVKQLDKELLIENVERLKELNKRFKVLNSSNLGEFTTERSKDARAWALSDYKRNANDYSISLVKKHFKDGKALEAALIRERITSYKMPFENEYARTYTITHEYGHILESSISIKRTDWDAIENKIAGMVNPSYSQIRSVYDSEEIRQADIIKDEILSIAKNNNPQFDMVLNLSKYGDKNSFEFFAEAFANSQCGRPNELGKAMEEWLIKEGY